MTRLAIIIVSYNAREDLAATLESLTTAPPGVPHEIVVVDNASADGAPALVRARYPAVRLIEAGGNVGFARASNLGIRETTSELVLLLNPDTIVTAGAIDRLVAHLDRSPGVAVVGPRIVDSDGHAELSFGGPMSPWRELGRKVLVALDRRGLGLASRYIEWATSREATPAWVTGACLLVRRRDAEAVGLLDERYFLYVEDVDFCASIMRLGRAVHFTPEAQVVHARGRSGAATGAAARRAWHASHLAYYRKRLPTWAPWLERYLRARGHIDD